MFVNCIVFKSKLYLPIFLIQKQKQLELQQELQRIQDELNEKAAIAEAEILRIETEKAAIEVEIFEIALLIKYFCKI